LQIQTLKLQSFRNYERAELNFTKNIVLIVGNNAQGKTNLVESIYTLAFSKSYRARSLQELMKEGSDFSKIDATIKFANGQQKSVQYVFTRKQKRIKVNNVEQKTNSDFVGLIKVIKFSPEDLNLIKGTPSMRRKFLNMHLSQLDRGYLYALIKYNHLLKQKNALLKLKTQDLTLLDVYNEQLAQLIHIIVGKRRTFIENYKPLVDQVFTNIVAERETLVLNYVSLFTDKSVGEIKAMLDEYTQKEIRYCGALIGIQKDDLQFLINERDARAFGSQGQQRTLVLALIIALVQYIYHEIGEYPILVLDDVMSELDEARKLQLIHSFQQEMQIFLTTTSVEDIVEKIALPYELYEVTQGKISKVGEY